MLLNDAKLIRVAISALSAVLYGFLEWRYINNEEKNPAETNALNERSVLSNIRPYHFFMAMLFTAISYSPDWFEWVFGFLLMILIEDISYFVMRGRWIREGEWTTNLMGSVKIGGAVIPNWYFFFLSLILLACFIRFFVLKG